MDTMIKTVIDRAALDAFVDGALSPEESARIVLHLADCPADQAYVDAVMETNALLAAAYAEPMHAPLPDRLRATIFPEAPAGSAAARPPSRSGWRAALRGPRRAFWGALAATCALAVGVGTGVVSNWGADDDLAARPPGGDAELAVALQDSPSGAEVQTAAGSTITLIASFLDGAGRPCREYEILDLAAGALTEGVACREASGAWTPEIAVAARLPEAQDRGDAYVPASGAGDEAIGAALDRLEAGMAMTPAEEQALLAADWAN
jgi:hypothetical protein